MCVGGGRKPSTQRYVKLYREKDNSPKKREKSGESLAKQDFLRQLYKTNISIFQTRDWNDFHAVFICVCHILAS